MIEMHRVRVHPDHQRRVRAASPHRAGAAHSRTMIRARRRETTEEQAAAQALHESAGYTLADTREVTGFKCTVCTKRLTSVPDS